MLDHLGAFAEAHGGPKMAQNSTKMAQNITKIALHGPKCPYMTPNGPKTLDMGILHDILSSWTTLGPFRRPTGAPQWPKTAPKMDLHDQNWPFMTPNDPKTLQMGILHDYMSYWTTLGPFRGPQGPKNGAKQH